MVRQSLWVCVFWAVGGCATNAENAPAVPDAAGAIAENTTSHDSETAETTKPDTSRGDVSVDGSSLTNDTSVSSTSGSAPLTAVDATMAGDDAGVVSGISCDVRKLTCKRAEPSCDYGYVPRIVDGCYAECVRIDDCVCSGADACPQHERYTCNNSRQRCTPYLN